jgi:hypothetical protein
MLNNLKPISFIEIAAIINQICHAVNWRGTALLGEPDGVSMLKNEMQIIASLSSNEAIGSFIATMTRLRYRIQQPTTRAVLTRMFYAAFQDFFQNEVWDSPEVKLLLQPSIFMSGGYQNTPRNAGYVSQIEAALPTLYKKLQEFVIFYNTPGNRPPDAPKIEDTVIFTRGDFIQ